MLRVLLVPENTGTHIGPEVTKCKWIGRNCVKQQKGTESLRKMRADVVVA